MTFFSILSIIVGIISLLQSLLAMGAAGLGAGLSEMAGEKTAQAMFGGMAFVGLMGFVSAILAIVAAIMLLVKKKTGYKVAIAAVVCLGTGVLLAFAGGLSPTDYVIYLCIYGGMALSGRSYFAETVSDMTQMHTANYTYSPTAGSGQPLTPSQNTSAPAKSESRTLAKEQPAEQPPAPYGVCQSCHAPLKSDAKFCTKCGALVTAAPQPDAASAKIVCKNCGAELAPGAKFCDKCGTPVSAELAPAPAPAKQVCANCGEELRPGAKFCDKCGTPTGSEPAPATNDDGGSHEHSVHYHCPKCHQDVEADTTVCPGCGAHLKPHSSPEAQHKAVRYRCPKCRHELEAGMTQCPGCGVRLKPVASQS